MQIIKAVVPGMRATGNLQWDDTYPNPKAFDEDIALNQLWVAVIADELAGVAAITTDQYAEYADVGLDLSEPAIVVHRLAVDPKFRGKGVAVDLLMQAEHEAIKRGIAALRIDTNSQNNAARALFPKLGYMYAGEIGLDFRPGLRFCCFEKRLDGKA
jgi:ribosomal protein S18 acetylase RimI-like enzyme